MKTEKSYSWLPKDNRQHSKSRRGQCGCAHPAVDPLIRMKPKRSVSGSDPELSSSLRFF